MGPPQKAWIETTKSLSDTIGSIPTETVEGTSSNIAHGRPRNQSSHIKGWDYDKRAKELTIHFNGGRSYTYRDVPEQVHENMQRDHSAGKYFHQVVKRHYKVK